MSAAGLVDSHAHVMDAAFDVDRADVLARARAAGIQGMLIVGYDLATSRAAVELARGLPHARAAVGIHPNSAGAASADDYAAIADLARTPEVAGIGETGLDNYRDFTAVDCQRASFEWHLSLASDLNLPVIIHNRQADADILHIAPSSGVRGVLHCFSSTDVPYLESMLEAGYFVSFAGPLTFKNATGIRAMAARVPHERLLVETDCPYLAPEPHRGRRNEPAYVRDTATCLASVVGLSLDALAELIWANSVCLFPLLEREFVA